MPLIIFFLTVAFSLIALTVSAELLCQWESADPNIFCGSEFRAAVCEQKSTLGCHLSVAATALVIMDKRYLSTDKWLARRGGGSNLGGIRIFCNCD